MKELGSGTAYNTRNTTSLIRTLKHVSDILQTEEAFTVEEYTHTHTPAQNRGNKQKRLSLKPHIIEKTFIGCYKMEIFLLYRNLVRKLKRGNF